MFNSDELNKIFCYINLYNFSPLTLKIKHKLFQCTYKFLLTQCKHADSIPRVSLAFSFPKGRLILSFFLLGMERKIEEKFQKPSSLLDFPEFF